MLWFQVRRIQAKIERPKENVGLEADPLLIKAWLYDMMSTDETLPKLQIQSKPSLDII